MIHRPKLAVVCLASLLLVSCASPQLEDPREELHSIAPAAWPQGYGSAPSGAWLERFDDRALLQLEQEAQERNFGLEAAYQQTRAAEAVVRIAGSLRFPSLGLGLRSGRSESLVNYDPPVAATAETHALTLSASWEIDVWNRIGLGRKAARAEYQASAYDLEMFRLSLASQVAKSWFSAAEAKLQHALALATADTYESNLNTLERRYSRGLVDAFDLRLTRAQAAASRASAINRRNQLDTITRSLEILLGRYPSGSIETAEALPALAPLPDLGLPAELLTRRPDLLAEEKRLAAALYQNAAARRNWLPSLFLTGSGGTVSPEFSQLLDTDFTVWSLAGDIAATLFQGGRLEAERDQLNALQLAQIARYKETALVAFREVESALQAEADLAELEEQTRLSAEESEQAKNQAWNLYERGLLDITAVLEAERRSFEARSQLISIHNQRLQNRINLHVALGGDF